MSEDRITGRYRCDFCKGFWNFKVENPQIVAATTRIFSGIMSDGFSSCDEHRHLAIEHAFAQFDKVHAGYEVVCFRVTESNDGWPQLGYQLWRVSKK